MSERVEFGVFKWSRHEGVFSVGVTSSPVWKDKHDADKFAASLNAREEELERLRAENAAQASEIGRLRGALKHQQSALMLLLDRQCPDGVVTVSEHDVRLGLKQIDAAIADKEPTQ